MEDHRCDVCDAPASKACSNCLQAVYCSVSCQTRDYPEHVDECVHIDDMTPEQIDAELDSDELQELETTEQRREWLGAAIRADLIGGELRQQARARRFAKKSTKASGRAGKLKTKRLNKKNFKR